MTSSHVARERSRAHPIDRISNARHHIKGIAVIIEYAVEKHGEDGDGVSSMMLMAGLSAIGYFADEIEQGVDELLTGHKVAEVRR